MFVGIDPGTNKSAPGGVALVDDWAGYVDGFRMPIRGRGSKTVVDGDELRNRLSDWATRHQLATVTVEQVGSRPGEGIGSAFAFGHAAGIPEGIAIGLGLVVKLVTPSVWKRALEIPGKTIDSTAGLEAARRFWPDAPLKFKADGGIADALLIARYGLAVWSRGRTARCAYIYNQN